MAWYYCVTNAVLHKKGSSGAVGSKDRRSVCDVKRWSGDYAVRGRLERPRGRKSGGSSGTGISSWPTRAEGGERLLSATRKP